LQIINQLKLKIMAEGGGRAGDGARRRGGTFRAGAPNARGR
jgi:hypothetical protein